MEGHPDFEPPLSRKPKNPLSAFGLVTSTLWLVAMAAGFGGFFLWYFYTLEEEVQPDTPFVHAPEQARQPVHEAPPPTDILLQNMNTQAPRTFRAVLFGHPLKHCAVRVNSFQSRDSFLIAFVRAGERLPLKLPRGHYQGVLACGLHWDDQDLSFAGVAPLVYRDHDFFAQVQARQATGVDLGGLWEKGGYGQ